MTSGEHIGNFQMYKLQIIPVVKKRNSRTDLKNVYDQVYLNSDMVKTAFTHT